jgi:hypothetical protein
MQMVSLSNDNSAIAVLRLTLDELFTDRRFYVRQSMSAGQVAGYILNLVQQGERDVDQLKASAFEKFSGTSPARLSSSDSIRTAT